MAYEDVTLQCLDCGENFVFTAGEQEFYESKGLVNTPKRCQRCRNDRKHASRGNKQQRKLYDVICSECGVETKVPFRPSEDKPVYCKECFDKMRSTV